ncbi:MAG: hypothetical protein A4E28_01392 [Methanocella sp. PtaU1.Bin125]|nr:MAG: hypothetical protein A4E28_01392 [Methanocella sp. PtaU1.Bin125]
MNWLLIIGLVIAGIVLVLAVAATGMGVLFCGDIMSYTAPGSKTLSPSGKPAGKALVAYNPGLSGEARRAAETIAGDLQSKGYTVSLAGIKSADAANISGYDVVVAGGPMYWGRVSNSVDAYLKGLKPQNGVKLGVFGTTGWSEPNTADMATLGQQVAACPCNGMLNQAPVIKTLRNGEAAGIDCADFVSAVLQ